MELKLKKAQNSILSFSDDLNKFLERIPIGDVKNASIDSLDKQTLLIYFSRKRDINDLNDLVTKVRNSKIPADPICTDESEKGYLITLYPKGVYTTTIVYKV